jgi:hypothetical protein
MTPLAVQSHRPNAPCILGSSRPRKSSSSPRTVLKTCSATMMVVYAYEHGLAKPGT